jgi:hypothetical protein
VGETVCHRTPPYVGSGDRFAETSPGRFPNRGITASILWLDRPNWRMSLAMEDVPDQG